MGKSARANCRRSVRAERRDIVFNSEKEIKQFAAKQSALEKALNCGKAPITDSLRRKEQQQQQLGDDDKMMTDDENNNNSNGGEQRLKLQEFDEDVYDKMKLHEKMYDEANAWGVSLGINKKVLRVKGGGVRRGKEKGVISAKQMAYAQFFADPKLKKKQKRAMKNVERGVRRGTSSSTSRKMMMTE
ncbi:unnamed protein product [Bathycoccus prasinos]|jgi:hypothetical protein|tara:strand:- start:570 stop:1130 length:561 start_codon:yes stop_codon:yes gene_type:complete